jgi:hypothetical protein
MISFLILHDIIIPWIPTRDKDRSDTILHAEKTGADGEAVHTGLLFDLH